ncbi:DNA damage-inducible protein I [Citrobacter sp. wls826]|nr:DNA damage-inducible protein I [Citrobacter sp. TSA-1]TKU18720.1 DNA damage-inducible protein I [Citrobacter sp. wls826]TKV34521.1 DNA damage-inducible protein I [Citrobacter sp. TBCS-11]
MDVQCIKAEGIMKVEITIDHTKKLPKGAVPALEKELLRRINQDYSDCKLTIRRTGSDGLSGIGGEKSDKKCIEEILQETWESADEWFFN